jgi:hypothetical protein
VERFGYLSEFSGLVFDTRGVDQSRVPRGPYNLSRSLPMIMSSRTSRMETDGLALLDLLDYIGWYDK